MTDGLGPKQALPDGQAVQMDVYGSALDCVNHQRIYAVVYQPSPSPFASSLSRFGRGGGGWMRRPNHAKVRQDFPVYPGISDRAGDTADNAGPTTRAPLYPPHHRRWPLPQHRLRHCPGPAGLPLVRHPGRPEPLRRHRLYRLPPPALRPPLPDPQHRPGAGGGLVRRTVGGHRRRAGPLRPGHRSLRPLPRGRRIGHGRLPGSGRDPLGRHDGLRPLPLRPPERPIRAVRGRGLAGGRGQASPLRWRQHSGPLPGPGRYPLGGDRIRRRVEYPCRGRACPCPRRPPGGRPVAPTACPTTG